MKKLKLSSLKRTTSHWLNDLKAKIANFDIKPSVVTVQSLHSLAAEAIVAGDDLAAEQYLSKILTHKQINYDALLKLSEIYLKKHEYDNCYKLLQRALRYYPDEYRFHYMLAQVHMVRGDLKACARAYKETLRLNPDFTLVQHLLDAAQQNDTALAPREYIVGVFDSYADIFEHSLLVGLKYRAHIELLNFIKSIITMPITTPTVLDLGCGTGLFGQELVIDFKPQVLIGVDLAPKMLARCQEKKIYTQLHNADLIEYLKQCNDCFDLITSSDVLIYFGDLTMVLTLANERLKVGGCFAFSLEAMAGGTFKLMPNGRYQHSLSYIQRLSSSFNFSGIYSKLIDLRTEYGKMVPGYLILLQK